MEKEVRTILDKEAAEGYGLYQVTFQMESGCRACHKEQDSEWQVFFIGRRFEERRLYVYCFVTLCSDCIDNQRMHERVQVRMMNLFESVN